MEAKIHNGAADCDRSAFARVPRRGRFLCANTAGTDIAFLSGVMLYLLTNENTTVNTPGPIPMPA